MAVVDSPRRSPARRPTSAVATRRAGRRRQAEVPAPRTTVSRAWGSPVTSYYLIGGSTLLLLLLGLMMVLSSSSVRSLQESGSPFGAFLNQTRFALVALPVAVVISRIPPHWFRRLAWPGMFIAAAMQALVFVPGLRAAAGGNAGWVVIGGQNLQPAEFGKLGLALWLGAVLGAKGPLLRRWTHVLFPAVFVAVGFLAMLLYTHDVGTALVLILLIAGALWVAGVPMAMFTVAGTGVTAAVAYLVVSSDNRRERIAMLFGGGDSDPLGMGLQPRRALQGLGTGGVSGVGLGESREKWLWLPEAHNDYIFAIIGEELGLLGTLLVLALFTALAIGFTRVIRNHPDRFVKITTAAIGAWILSQALINIGVVIGIFPVIGLPLPLVSAGGSALVTTMAALGIVLAFARHEPGAQEALAARRSSMRNSLSVVAPRRRGR
ncbi:MAG TPA: putative peptidoglycan glycosyltransferase FtsW [Beutenbergiaceae bacterium]|nr:putative peptidoglycan glycosyltransferase FtsW [Beutenbergiaceae bacterium]